MKKKKEFAPFTCWIFDENNRVYMHDDGTKSAAPIWRKHWLKTEIVAETRKFWVTSYGRKIVKEDNSSICLTEGDVDKRVWVQENKYKISEEVRYCTIYSKLQAIKEILESNL